jgi:hypothetical protein
VPRGGGSGAAAGAGETPKRRSGRQPIALFLYRIHYRFRYRIRRKLPLQSPSKPTSSLSFILAINPFMTRTYYFNTPTGDLGRKQVVFAFKTAAIGRSATPPGDPSP